MTRYLLSHSSDLELVIRDESTIDRPLGWIFSWNSKKYIETKEPRYRIIGNGPVYVNKCDHSLEEVDTSGTEEAIGQYEQEWATTHGPTHGVTRPEPFHWPKRRNAFAKAWSFMRRFGRPQPP